MAWAEAGSQPASTAKMKPVDRMKRTGRREAPPDGAMRERRSRVRSMRATGRTLCFRQSATSRRLGGSRQPRQAAQDRHGSLQALLGLLPVVEEHDLHIGPDLGVRSLLAD